MLLSPFRPWIIVPMVALVLGLGCLMSQPAIATSAVSSETLETTISEFLQGIPNDYYGVRDVEPRGGRLTMSVGSRPSDALSIEKQSMKIKMGSILGAKGFSVEVVVSRIS